MITDLERLVATVMQISARMAVTGMQWYTWRLTQVNRQNKGYVNVEQHNSYWLAIQH